MRPILLFAIAAVAASAVGVGALNNEILLTVQQFGVGSADIESPIDAASVDFEIDLVPVVDEETQETIAFKNLITGCSFHSDQSVEDEDTNPNNNPRIICKLSDDGVIVAEGSLELPSGYDASDREIVPITELAFPGANDFRNINDVHLIVVGQDPTVVEPEEVAAP
jgi:hypothetical protein